MTSAIECPQSGQPRMTVIGRVLVVMSGSFADTEPERGRSGQRAASEKPDGQVWVDGYQPLQAQAVIEDLARSTELIRLLLAVPPPVEPAIVEGQLSVRAVARIVLCDRPESVWIRRFAAIAGFDARRVTRSRAVEGDRSVHTPMRY